MVETVYCEPVIWSHFVTCTESLIRLNVPAKPGVYILYSLDQPLLNGHTVPGSAFYVGRALNLQERLIEHLSPCEPNACLKSQIRDARVSFGVVHADRIAGVEKFLFNTLRPSCNVLDPGGLPIPVHYLPNAGRPEFN